MAAEASIGARVVGKVERWLARQGYEIVRRRPEEIDSFDPSPGASALKLAERQARFEQGGAFEPPEERALHHAVARFVGRAKSIVCQGSGTGIFEHFVSVDPALEILGVAPDSDLLAWCRTHRAAPNVAFTDCDLSQLFEQAGTFDLALAIDVLDRTDDFAGTLRAFSRLSARGVLTATNRARVHGARTATRSNGDSTTREWTAGEFYWVLRIFYRSVELYGMPDPNVPSLERVGLFSKMSPLVAVCER